MYVYITLWLCKGSQKVRPKAKHHKKSLSKIANSFRDASKSYVPLGLDQGKSWSEAKNNCNSHGGRLMEVRTQLEFAKAQFLRETLGEDFYLGGSEPTWEGIWRWQSNGDWIGKDNEYWIEGQPGDNDGVRDCMRMSMSGFSDASCSSTRPFVCEFD